MFTQKLFPVQKPAASFLCSKKKALLAWEQGTGKTIISLAAAEKLRQLDRVSRTLVVAPGSLLWQWEDRIKEFTTGTSTLTKAKDKGSRRYEEHCSDYSLVPYSLFRRDFEELLGAWQWDLMITDEAQEFRNNKSKTHDLLKHLNREVNPAYRWALTGTAITNKLEDLYSIMYWVDKHFLPPWPTFDEEHIVRNQFGGIESYRNLKGLNEYLPHRVDRKTEKDMAGQLPKARELVHTISRSEGYEQAESELLDCLQQMVENLEFNEKGELKGHRPDSRVSRAFHKARGELCSDEKLKYARRLIQEGWQDGHKTVVFSYFKEPLVRLTDELSSQGFNAYRFTGDEDSDTKRRNVQLFKEDPRGVLLCSNAGAAGLDLPFASRLINLDIPFAFGTLDQRIKRIIRASSKFESVVVHYLVMEDSLEAFYFMIVRKKGELQTAILDRNDIDEVVVRPMSLRQYLIGDKDD